MERNCKGKELELHEEGGRRGRLDKAARRKDTKSTGTIPQANIETLTNCATMEAYNLIVLLVYSRPAASLLFTSRGRSRKVVIKGAAKSVGSRVRQWYRTMVQSLFMAS